MPPTPPSDQDAPMVTLDQAWDAIVAAIVAQLDDLKAQTRREAQAQEKQA